MKDLTRAGFRTKLLCVKTPKTISFFMQKAYPLFLDDASGFEGEIGGAEMDFYVIATELAKNRDFRVTFYTGDYGQPERIGVLDNLVLRKLSFWNEKIYPRWYHKFLRRFCSIWILLRDRSDIFFGEAHTELWGYIVLVAKFFLRKPTVYRIASDLDLRLLKDRKFSVYDLIFEFGFRFTDFFIAQNSMQRGILESDRGKKSVEIKNALRDTPVSPDIVEEKQLVLWVGRGIPLKQPLKFVELARSLPDERFLMVFPGKGDLKDETVREATGLGNLEVVDFVDPTKIQDTYSRAKCLVNTSTHEGFPNSFVQAFIGGTPVVALNVDPGRILDRYDIGHCCHGDLAQAVDYIRSLSTKRLHELYTNCRAYFRENHDIATVISQYEALFADITSRGARE